MPCHLRPSWPRNLQRSTRHRCARNNRRLHRPRGCRRHPVNLAHLTGSWSEPRLTSGRGLTIPPGTSHELIREAVPGQLVGATPARAGQDDQCGCRDCEPGATPRIAMSHSVNLLARRGPSLHFGTRQTSSQRNAFPDRFPPVTSLLRGTGRRRDRNWRCGLVVSSCIIYV